MNWLTGTLCTKLAPHMYSQSIVSPDTDAFIPELASHLIRGVHDPLSDSFNAVLNMIEWTVGEELWL